MSERFFNERLDDMRAMYGIGFAVKSPNGIAKISGVTGSRQATADAIADLRKKDPDGYANLAEHLPLSEMEQELRG